MAVADLARFHQERMSGIGSADAPVILGISGFKTPMELWLEKTGQRAPEDLSDNDAVHWGEKLEDVIAQEFAERHPGLTVRRHRRVIRSRRHPFALAHLDRATRNAEGIMAPLEIKTSSKWDDWKEGVPVYYLPQVQHQMLVTNAPYAYVAVLVNGRYWKEYTIERDDEFIEGLIAEEAAFMECIRTLTPPDPRTYSDVCLRYPIAEKGAQCVARGTVLEAAHEYAEVNAHRIALEKREEELKMTLGMALGNAQTLVDEGGTPLLNFTSSERSGFDERTFALEEPDMHSRYIRPIRYRQMRILKGLKAA